MAIYQSAFDSTQSLVVWCIQGAAMNAEQWQRHLSDMERVASWGGTSIRPSVLLHLVDDRFVPNAAQRTQIAEMSRSPNYRPNIALITGSPVMRGVLRTFSWFQGKAPYRIEPFEGLAEGIRWLEAERNLPLPKLLEMVEEVHRAMNVSPILVAMARKNLAPLSA